MQAALLMTEELLGFLVRPSYYRKLITSRGGTPPEGTPASGPVASGIESGLWADDRCKMFSYHEGSLVTAPVLP